MGHQNNYGYSIIYNKEILSTKPAYTLNTHWNIHEDTNYVAEEAAEQYHDDHDGFEATWPLLIQLFDEDNNSVALQEVEREFEPVFSSRETN